MKQKIYFKDLDCFKKLSEEEKCHKLISPERCFDFGNINSPVIAAELEKFIIYRGQTLQALSMRAEFTPFHQFCEVINEEFPDLNDLLDIESAELLRAAKKWLLKHGKKVVREYIDPSTGYLKVDNVELLRYINRLYDFLLPKERTFCYESDRWYLENIPIKVKRNPTKNRNSLSFKKIMQPIIKTEVKQVIYLHLSQISLNTVAAEITAVNRFSAWLQNAYPAIKSLKELDREHFEDYLIYLNTEAAERQSYDKDLHHLKSVFITAGKIFGSKVLEYLIIPEDITPAAQCIFKTYSTEEQKCLNEAMVAHFPKQLARVMLLQQILGTRISDILTLRQDAVYISEAGMCMIKIHQVKTKKTYSKVFSDDAKKIFDAACKYTREQFGNREFVFVDKNYPEKPLQYATLYYHLKALITKHDLQDDNGDPFDVSTHAWRRSYGQALTELDLDDTVIAELLGHSNTSSLKAYRKVGDTMLAEKTRDVREEMDILISNITRNEEI